MASNIKGITIEIGGNTTKLESALKGVNKEVYSLNSDLKSLNQALKLDPKNTELLAQKQDVLKRNIQATTERLNTLKETQRQMGDYNKLTDEQKSSYNRLSTEIAKSENALKGMNKELKESSKIDLGKLKDGLKKVGEVAAEVTKKMLQVTAAIGTALAGLVTAGVKSYADLEQNLGGVETLFGENANKVIENAKNAYKTAGVSANEYMAGVTSFSASLLQSLGGDTAKAADIADMAFRDMSDNANKFGTDMSSIQNAYQGFAKQNYTMLDNLKLGYGGTKTEMERLLKDAEKLSGKKYNIKNLNDVYEAIHVVQKELGITGTTAEEAKKTISGSISSMKAAFSNFLNGSGSPEALAESITNVLKNIGNAITKLAPSILSGIVSLIKTLVPQISNLIMGLVPQLLTSISSMIDTLLSMLTKNTDKLAATITNMINLVVSFLVENLPKIVEMGLMILVSLAQGIAQNLATIIPQIVDCILLIVDTIVDNIDLIIAAGIQIIVALIEGLTDPEVLTKLISKIPMIIGKMIVAIVENLPKIFQAGVKILLSIGEGILSVIGKVTEWVGKIFSVIKEGILAIPSKAVEWGGNIVNGLINGFKGAFSFLGSTVKELVSTIINEIKELPAKMFTWGKDMVVGLANGIKSAIGSVGKAAGNVASKITSILHFSRPDEGPLREYEKWMPDFVKGLAKGIESSSYLLENATDKLASGVADSLMQKISFVDTTNAMRQLSSGIENSISPIINPQVNTNPLTIQIENFYNNRNSDVQSLSQEIEFYRRQSAQSRGGF